MSLQDEVYKAADTLRALANQGLCFAADGYARERYTQILNVSAHLVAALEHRATDEVMAEYEGDFGHMGPHAGVDAAVFRDDKLLLIRRQDNGLWALPGGFIEPGETLAEAVRRELHEEAGVEGRIVSLLAVLDSRLWKSSVKFQLYHHIFFADIDDATPHALGGDGDGPTAETLDGGFYGEHELPELHAGHRDWVPLVFKLYRGEVKAPYFDGDESGT